MTAEEVRALIREKARDAGSQKAWAEQHGCSAQYVSDVLSGAREPSGAILSALGLVRRVTYEPSH